MTSTAGDAVGPVGHGADGLGAADPVHLVDPGDGRRASVASSTLPSEAGGTHRAMLPTPATRAGAAHMRTVEG